MSSFADNFLEILFCLDRHDMSLSFPNTADTNYLPDLAIEPRFVSITVQALCVLWAFYHLSHKDMLTNVLSWCYFSVLELNTSQPTLFRVVERQDCVFVCE